MLTQIYYQHKQHAQKNTRDNARRICDRASRLHAASGVRCDQLPNHYRLYECTQWTGSVSVDGWSGHGGYVCAMSGRRRLRHRVCVQYGEFVFEWKCGECGLVWVEIGMY